MELFITIGINALIAMILIAGFFIGRANGFKIQFTKLIVLLGASIGLFFLTPVLFNTLLGTPIAAVMVKNIFVSLSIINLFLFMLTYLLITFVFFVIKKISRREEIFRKDKRDILYKGETKDQSKLRKEQHSRFTKQKRKEQKKEFARNHRINRYLGAFFGIITSLIIIVIMILPINILIKEKYNNAVNHNAVGAIETTFDGQDKLLKAWTKRINILKVMDVLEKEGQ